jgi:hypothetical protein
MKLAAISGVNGVYSDADIRRVRKLALAARAKGTPPRVKAAAKGAARKSVKATARSVARTTTRTATKTTAKTAAKTGARKRAVTARKSTRVA